MTAPETVPGTRNIATGTETPESVSYREVTELLRTFAASGWTGMTLRVDGLNITVGRHGPPAGTVAVPPVPSVPAAPSAPAATPEVAAAPRPAEAAAPPESDRGAEPDLTGCVPVRSPAIGAFWTAPSPGAPSFTEPGQTVAEGDQLAIVEVMKLMNPVLAPQAGEIVQVCAANAELVEYDQVLFMLRPVEPASG
jgi:acetyl-CoA carboxylase biotin carboxyl carrier protein